MLRLTTLWVHVIQQAYLDKQPFIMLFCYLIMVCDYVGMSSQWLISPITSLCSDYTSNFMLWFMLPVKHGQKWVISVRVWRKTVILLWQKQIKKKRNIYRNKFVKTSTLLVMVLILWVYYHSLDFKNRIHCRMENDK